MKLILLLRGGKPESYHDFCNHVHSVARQIIDRLQPTSLWLTVTETSPPALSVIPYKKDKIAAISVIAENAQPMDAFRDIAGFAGLYTAEEAIPVAYSRNWPLETVTPGACLLTLFRKKPGISYERFLDRWHNSHTPLSLRIHPLWHYNRNVVKPQGLGTGEDAGQPWDGIVEEHFRTPADLINPFRFFGNPLVILPRMLEVYSDTNAFLDYKTVEPWFVREYCYV